jgi:hypothetical protein
MRSPLLVTRAVVVFVGTVVGFGCQAKGQPRPPLPPLGQVDLVPLVDSDCPFTSQGETYLVRFTVKNVGTRASLDSTTKVKSGGEIVLDATPGIDAGQSWSHTVKIDRPMPHPVVSYEVEVDFGNAVVEKDDSNNKIEGTCQK